MSGKRKSREAARQRLLEGIGSPENLEFIIDDFQREAIISISGGNDTLVVAPTGAGKTHIAFEAIAAALGSGARAVYTTPLKALSNTKYSELKARFEPEYQVGLLTGDRKIDVNADVVVATTEIYRNELYRDVGRYSVVVLDEVHYISDLQRGPVWEESIILTPRDSALLMLSASISNPEEIADWLEEVRGRKCQIVIKSERPVELRLAFLDPDEGVLPLEDEKGNVYKEVQYYYGSTSLDASGFRLKTKSDGGRGGRGKGNRRRGSRNSGSKRGGSRGKGSGRGGRK